VDENELLQIIEQAARDHWTDLDLANKNLTILPPQVGQLINLQELHLSRNHLTTLPAEVGQLANLRELGVGSNRLTTLPSELGHLQHLEELYLDWNQLSVLPREIGNLTSLMKLELHVNRLSALPAEIGQLANLRKLGVGSNQLTSLPSELGHLQHLEELYLDHNQLTVFPSVVLSLRALIRLDIASNGLSTLPAAIRQFPYLKMLGLRENKLTELPGELGELSNLTDLYLDRNHLTTLPPEIRRLTQLQWLYLAHNHLTTLPESLEQLTQLQRLDVAHNCLTALPESLERLPQLQELYLHSNPALGLPPEVFGPTWEEVGDRKAYPAHPASILQYYFRSRASRPLNEAKLILVGRGGVGKTSLVQRLVDNRFDPNEKKTEGIQITEWPLRLHGHEDVRLHIWDFGGQEIMHATHQFFLTQRSLYLLVLNGREGGEDADADYWLKLITSFGGDSPVMVVLNKIKEHAFDLNRRALQQKYPFIRDFVKTDCADGTGIIALREAIERETDRLEHLRDAFPASWFTIKDQLAKMKKNYLSFDEYCALCAECGEVDAKAQEDLAGYLHTLGIVLNYKDDPRLQDTHVLNPHWATHGIYKILNADKLEQQQGEIRLRELAEILDASEYPGHMRRFILDLMKQFELCFSFPDDETHYLIPELLDKQESLKAAAFPPETCLHFQYHYPVLPEGLLPRLIVRTHVLSEGLPRWRTGVILAFEGCKALVKADGQEKKVFIAVTGPAAARRRLLAVIRSDFERIHHDIRNLQPQEMVPLPEYPGVVVPYQNLLVMEKSGIRTFPVVVDDRVIEVDVHTLLNGVELEGTRHREKTQAVRLFYSYSHKDEALRNKLETHLKLLERQGLLEPWHDRKIEAGKEWKQKIDDNLERADIILLLVSADFIASDYCYEKELKRALERHEKGEARVVPVIVRDVNWRSASFARLQALPKDGRAVTLWEDRDSAWRNVSEGIERVVEEIRKRKV
jgi:internalin A